MTAAQTLRSLTGIAVVAALAGCSANPMHAMTGRIMTGHAEQHVTPEMFAMSDSRLVCASGTALEPLMASFARVGEPSDKSLTLLWLLAGACAEQQAWDAEMRYLRAERKADLEAARDARSDQQRWLQLAAERRLQSYRHALRAYDYDASQAEPSCPSLATPQDEVTFLLGLMTGLQAILNDANSGALADVPRDIALQTERAAACVDNTRWAGMPDALRASVWTLLPDSRPSPDVQPLEVLRTSSEMGVTQGLRVAGALEVIMAENLGDQARLNDAMARFAAAEQTLRVNTEYRLMDVFARDQVMAVSDRYWTRNHGERTPPRLFGQLSRTVETPAVTEEVLDDLL